MHLAHQPPGELHHQALDGLHETLSELEAAVDAICSDDPASVATATAALIGLAGRHPALVLAYWRTLVCVARVRSRLAEGPALLELLRRLGLAGHTDAGVVRA